VTHAVSAESMLATDHGTFTPTVSEMTA